MKRCCEKSGINWDVPMCPECFIEMKLHKSTKKKRRRHTDKLGSFYLRDLNDKYICPNCGYSQLPETLRDKEIRTGII